MDVEHQHFDLSGYLLVGNISHKASSDGCRTSTTSTFESSLHGKSSHKASSDGCRTSTATLDTAALIAAGSQSKF